MRNTSEETIELYSSVKFGAHTEKGLREKNQDAMLLLPRGPLYTFALADGAGGHALGEKASQMTLNAIENELKNNQEYRMTYLEKLIAKKYEQINRYVFRAGRDSGQTMVTTLSMVNILDQHMLISNVGDTNIYRIRNGQIDLISYTHTFAWEAYRKGHISYEQIDFHKYRHVLTEAIGGTDKLNPYFKIIEVKKRDVYVLCTDGVYNFLKVKRLLSLFSSSKLYSSDELSHICAECVKEAIDNKSSDNLSIIALQI